jgi:3-keto-5-aminohexanoate cleavage enzyme
LFTVSAIGRYQWPLVTMGIILGGNVRVGLEDNLYLARGQKLKGNGEAVEKVVRLARELGREIATPAQARRMMGLSATPSSY